MTTDRFSVRVTPDIAERIVQEKTNNSTSAQDIISKALSMYFEKQGGTTGEKSPSSSERVMVFIDVRNINKSCDYKDSDPYRIDYTAAVRELVGNRTLVAAYMFDGQSDVAKPFHDSMSYRGFHVVLRDAYEPTENRQKEVDVSMASTMLSQAYKHTFDTAIVMSGDRDFLPSMELIREEGMRVEVAAFKSAMSHKLVGGCDKYTDLCKIPLFSFFGVPNKSTEVAE